MGNHSLAPGQRAGAIEIREILERAAIPAGGDVSMSMINIGEVFYVMAKRQGAAVAE